MRTMVRKCSILLALLAMFGLTIYAHRIIASGGGTFLPNLLSAGISTGGKADKAKVTTTFASAAALTQNPFVPEHNKAGEIALEPLQAGGSYNITTSVIAGGGGSSSGGGNQLTGTIGQAATGASAGGSFSLSGGFWNVSSVCSQISILPATLTDGMAGTPYPATQLMASGGVSPYTFTIPVGSLPSGMTLSPSGVLEGTPTAFGLFDFTVRSTDSTTTCFGERMYSLKILPPCGSISLGPQTLPNGFVGIAYPAQNFSAKGGTSPYTFSVSAGSLPDGLTLKAGVLSGTPTATGVFPFTVKATDNVGCMGTQSYTLVISDSSPNSLMFYPLSAPVRLLDTRAGQSGCTTPGMPVTGGTSLTQIARNFCGIPAAAKAVIGNVTVVLPTANGFLTIYPSDAATQPTAANTNFIAGDVLNNVFTVKLGDADGAFNIFASSTAQIVVDITGYYAPPTASGLYFHPLPQPVRLLETRVGQSGCFTPGATLPGNVDSIQQGTTTCNGITIPAAARALVGNATAVLPAANGFLTLYPADAASRPLAASGNYRSGINLNSPFTVGLSASGQFKIYTVATTDLVIDVLGYFSADASDVNGTGLLFTPMTPQRLLDTRAGQPGCFTPGSALAGGTESLQQARNVCSIGSTAQAIVGNVTTVLPASNGFLTFWPSNAASRPLVATSNFQSGRNFNRYFTVGLGTDGAFKMYASTTTNLVIDVSGYFAP